MTVVNKTLYAFTFLNISFRKGTLRLLVRKLRFSPKENFLTYGEA